MKNVPYVKLFKDGKLINPITKEKPYRSFPKKQKVTQASNNSKGIGVIVVNLGKGLIMKYNSYKQLIVCNNGKNKCITHYVEKTKFKKAA